VLPCLIFEDDHLLVVNKPAGLNTHAPSPYAGEGIYDWLRHREPRWARLAIIHRLDKETSGVMVFSKTPLGNRSLTEQFAERSVRKKYVLLTDRPLARNEVIARSSLVRAGDKYVSRPLHAGGEPAETRFRPAAGAEVRRLRTEVRDQRSGARKRPADPGCRMLEAQPLTGRTHQIRVHAADNGFPILGDTLYGGTPASRVCLHAAELTLRHPASGAEMTFCAPVDFSADSRSRLRTELTDPELTNSYRLVNGASDGWPGWHVDRLGDFLLSQSAQPLNAPQSEELDRLMRAFSARGAYHKLLTRQVRRASAAEASPQLALGEAAPERFIIRENGVQFELSFAEGYSVGLFLDQRDNRRRLLTRHIAAGFPLTDPTLDPRSSSLQVLNAFAYTCGFSVCAAMAGARTTSLDLSKKYLEWGKRNFALNQLAAAGHDFIFGDAMDWLRRLAKKQQAFDVILLDPPTFSQSKASGVFRVEEDYGKLVTAALPLLRPGGVLFASTNAANWPPEEFLAGVEGAIQSAGRKLLQKHYVPQPPDFPISRAEPAYLKTVWLRIE
jgi:23S rRNA (cytosine1962-C5)-methyltransferase